MVTLMVNTCSGEDNEESGATIGMHSVQIQDAIGTQALQTVRFFFAKTAQLYDSMRSFELGGEKKTKGAALTFVRPTLRPTWSPFLML